MTRGKRRYLVALVDDVTRCTRCKLLLPRDWPPWCSHECSVRWVIEHEEWAT